MEEQVVLTCPQCGKTISVTNDWRRVVCDKCGAVMTRDVEPTSDDFIDVVSSVRSKTRTAVCVVALLLILGAGVVFFTMSHVYYSTRYSYDDDYEVERELVDPWENVEIFYSGRSGEGHVVVEGNGYIYYSVNNNYNLKNGDEIVVTAESYTFDLTSTTKTFVLDEFEELLSDPSNLSDKALSLIERTSQVQNRKNIYDNSSKSTDTFTQPERVGLYVLSDDLENIVYDVYKVYWTTSKGAVYEFYTVVKYHNLVIRDDSTPITINYDTVTYVGNYGSPATHYGVSYSDVANDRTVCGYATYEDVQLDLIDKMDKPMKVNSYIVK